MAQPTTLTLSKLPSSFTLKSCFGEATFELGKWTTSSFYLKKLIVQMKVIAVLKWISELVKHI